MSTAASAAVTADTDGAVASSPEILDRILRHAELTPAAPAVCDFGRELDWAALRTEVGDVAAGLVARGIGPGDRVGVHLPNSVDFVVTALAALWVGAIFVPLAPADPVARVAVIVGDCDPAVIVTSPPGADAACYEDPRAVGYPELQAGGGSPPERAAGDNRPMYAIYTSGTTGTPKGVLIGQQAFVTAVAVIVATMGLDPTARTMCVSAFHFDGSFATLFPTLVAGGRVVIPPRDALLFPRTFFNAVARFGITCTGFSPSYLRLLLNSPKAAGLAATPLHLVGVGGEAVPRSEVEALRAVVPGVRIFNRYGPTETTISVTNHEIPPGPPDAPVPIGRPNPATTFVLVGEDGRVIDGAGRIGELYIGGPQLMLGYWGAPQLSAGVLRDDIVTGTTLYRSGDLVQRAPSGEYLYVDRADRVIKRSGVRISLVELTEVSRGVPGVTAAASALFDHDGMIGIVTFVVVDGALSAAEIQRAAHLHLPATMLPDRIVVVDALPLTPAAGKIDERRLLADAGLRPFGRGAAPARVN